jgi:hypothetical protein
MHFGEKKWWWWLEGGFIIEPYAGRYATDDIQRLTDTMEGVCLGYRRASSARIVSFKLKNAT